MVHDCVKVHGHLGGWVILAVSLISCGMQPALPDYPAREKQVPLSSGQGKPILVEPPPRVAEKPALPVKGPNLHMSTTFMDQDANDLLEANEQAVLIVEIQNRGDAPAMDLTVEVVGFPILVRTLGGPKSIAEIAPGWKKAVVFTGILPEKLPAGRSEFSVRVRNAKGDIMLTKSLQITLSQAAPSEALMIAKSALDPNPSDDVDQLKAQLPGPSFKDAVAVVVGISRYQVKSIPPVKHARHDAVMMTRYLERIAGVPRQKVKLLLDEKATCQAIKTAVEDWLPRQVGSRSTVFFYFAGHGMPGLEGRGAVMAPTDVAGAAESSLCYPLAHLYASLGKLPTRNAIVVLDASFSGLGERSIRPSPKLPYDHASPDDLSTPPGITIFAAATNTQVVSEYDKGLHGLFTYYLLKGLRGEADADRDGIVDVGEWYAYARDHVSRVASSELNREQTPVLLGGNLTLVVGRWKT